MTQWNIVAQYILWRCEIKIKIREKMKYHEREYRNKN